MFYEYYVINSILQKLAPAIRLLSSNMTFTIMPPQSIKKYTTLMERGLIL